MYSVEMKRTQKVAIGNVKAIDVQNKPSAIQGKPDWRTTRPDVADILPAENGLTCVIIGVGFGECDVIVRGDADLTGGVSFVETLIHVTIRPEQAVGFTLDIGVPEAQ